MKFDVGVVGEYEEDRNCCAVLLVHAPQLFEYEALVLTLRVLLESDGHIVTGKQIGRAHV